MDLGDKAGELAKTCLMANNGIWKLPEPGYQPDLLLLDEPAAGMNPAETTQLTKLINGYANGLD